MIVPDGGVNKKVETNKIQKNKDGIEIDIPKMKLASILQEATSTAVLGGMLTFAPFAGTKPPYGTGNK